MKRWMTVLGTVAGVLASAGCGPVVLDPVQPGSGGAGGSGSPATTTATSSSGGPGSRTETSQSGAPVTVMAMRLGDLPPPRDPTD